MSSSPPSKRSAQICAAVAVSIGGRLGAVQIAADAIKQIAAPITDYLNQPVQDIVAPEAGIILFVRAVPSLKKGDTLANVGVVKVDGK